MEKPSYKLVGAPCGHHGQYTFYKALRVVGATERIFAIGDFFFVRIWQDSELVSIGELQLLWTDRVSDQTLVSLRLYFLPENTPDGRNQQGEDEVLAINDKVVVRAEDLLSWVCDGAAWRWGLRAVWRGACAPPPAAPASAPLHHTRLDFSDVDQEKSAIEIDVDSPGVMVFSYPRYCRYRALLARLEGLQADWLRDSLVAALGGYAAPTKNTRILYCKDTFEYPELEGHEFVCNHLAPRLKGRPRGRRRAAPRSRTHSRSSDSDAPARPTPRRLSLRNGAERPSDEDEHDERKDTPEERAFMDQLRHFYKERNEPFKAEYTLKELSLCALYGAVCARGGYEAVCRRKLWRALCAHQPARTRRAYERYLLPYETASRRALPESPIRESRPTLLPEKRLRTPSPRPHTTIDNETGEIKDEFVISKPAEELNREFLDSLPRQERQDVTAKISVKPVEKLLEPAKVLQANGDLQKASFFNNFALNAEPPAPAEPAAPPQLNGHAQPDQKARPGRSSLRAVRVKPTRPPPAPPAGSPPTPLTNFGIHHPPTPISDDEIVEVPYKPNTPEIIDLDEYPESPQSVKKKKLDILKERGLEVTAVPPAWPLPIPNLPMINTPMILNPTVQHQIVSEAQLYQMYNVMPQYTNGIPPPRVIQGTSIFGSSGPEKTVYGNPKDPFMPPPHVLHGAPLKPQRVPTSTAPPQDILDLTCKSLTNRATVEIVRVPTTPSPSKIAPQNLSKNYTLVDGKAVVGSNLEITLVNKAHSPKSRPPQKRSSNGKFVSVKTPTPPKEIPGQKKPPLVIPSYQIARDDASPSSTQQVQKPAEVQKMPLTSFLDPYMALYSLAGQIDHRQLAAYRDLMTNQFRYPGLMNMGVSNTPTTKN